jgi:hypothetical protein
VLAGDADQCTSGLNFTGRRPRAAVLADYREVLRKIYAPAAYFGRARRAARLLDRSAHSIRPPLRHLLRDLRGFGRMAWRMGVRDPEVRLEWWKTLLDTALHNPAALKIVMSFVALYVHLGPFSTDLVARLDGMIERSPQAERPPVALAG